MNHFARYSTLCATLLSFALTVMSHAAEDAKKEEKPEKELSLTEHLNKATEILKKDAEARADLYAMISNSYARTELAEGVLAKREIYRLPQEIEFASELLANCPIDIIQGRVVKRGGLYIGLSDIFLEFQIPKGAPTMEEHVGQLVHLQRLGRKAFDDAYLARIKHLERRCEPTTEPKAGGGEKDSTAVPMSALGRSSTNEIPASALLRTISTLYMANGYSGWATENARFGVLTGYLQDQDALTAGVCLRLYPTYSRHLPGKFNDMENLFTRRLSFQIAGSFVLSRDEAKTADLGPVASIGLGYDLTHHLSLVGSYGVFSQLGTEEEAKKGMKEDFFWGVTLNAEFWQAIFGGFGK